MPARAARPLQCIQRLHPTAATLLQAVATRCFTGGAPDSRRWSVLVKPGSNAAWVSPLSRLATQTSHLRWWFDAPRLRLCACGHNVETSGSDVLVIKVMATLNLIAT